MGNLVDTIFPGVSSAYSGARSAYDSVFGKQQPPPAPDYAGAAQAQGAANLEATRAGAKLNNPNVVNPYGTQTVTYNGDIPTVTQKFSPEQQALYDQSVQSKGILGQVGTQGAESLRGVVGTPIDYTGAPAAPGDSQATRNAVINAMMTRVDSDTQQRREQVNSDLIARGIRPGTEAYKNEMDQIDRGYNDARQNAILAGGSEASRDFGMDTEARRNYITELLSKRQTPLNEITALMSGSQVSNPFQTPGYSQNANVAPAPVFGATTAAGNYAGDVYNSQVGQRNALMEGLFGIGAAYAGKPSDRRLKSNIVRIGDHPLGIGIYEYDIFGKHEVGVMAQEVLTVKPDAVRKMPSGYLYVDYGRL